MKAAFLEGGGSLNFERKFQTEGGVAQKTGVITLSCSIKISAVRSLVLSHSTRMKDGQTEGRADGRIRPTTPKTAL